MNKTSIYIIITALLVLALVSTGCTTKVASNIKPAEQVVIVVTATSEPVIPTSEVVEPTSEAILAAPEATAPATETTLENMAMGLNAEEAAALLFMIEEEKLARDVYNALSVKWNIQIFQKITASEQSHVDQIGVLIRNYDLPNPILAPGIFTDQNLQALYDTLIAKGNQSLADALKVGGAVEEIDILDLQTRISQTDNADIQQTYNNLLNGSYNHLKSFVNNLSTQSGETYSVQYLTPEQYQSILSSPQGKGPGQGKATPKP